MFYSFVVWLFNPYQLPLCSFSPETAYLEVLVASMNIFVELPFFQHLLG